MSEQKGAKQPTATASLKEYLNQPTQKPSVFS